MARKRIPLVTQPDLGYSASLPRLERSFEATQRSIPPPAEADSSTNALPAIEPDLSAAPEALSTKIDIRVTALLRQAADLERCRITPAQVIRAALRRATRQWTLSPIFIQPTTEKRVKTPGWTVRTTVAVPVAVFDRLLAAHDPLGVCSRWSLIRGQLEPVIWQELDQLLVTLCEDGSDEQTAAPQG